jgi:hypothetical protein
MRKILKVSPKTQRDNLIAPGYSCFPTSMGMATEYFLRLRGKDKTAIGCPVDAQIEDYLDAALGSAVAREDPATESEVFNHYMTPHGVQATFTHLTYQQLCAQIDNDIPVVIGGNFSSVSRIGGHINCCIGYDTDKQVVINNDPYGSAYKGYPNDISIEQSLADGAEVEYELKFFKGGVNMPCVVFNYI